MRDAFEELGYEVLEVSGDAKDRRKAIRRVRALLKSGIRPEFAYSESSVMPTALAERRHLLLRPMMDLSFLRSLRRANIPVGLFYRDVYWRFPVYRELLGVVKAAVARAFFRWDLYRYRSATDVLFLPSTRMAQYLPAPNRAHAHPLPPGADIRKLGPRRASEHVSLLYIGGIGPFYRLHQCVEGVAAANGAMLTICTRKQDWDSVKPEYADMLTSRVNVAHLSGDDLDGLYVDADVGVLFLEPQEYREFAAPLKLYEYLGAGKPVIAVEGSLAAEVVRDTGAGWVLPYSSQALSELLDTLANSPSELDRVSRIAEEVRHQHTWRARAESASRLLTSGRSTADHDQGVPG